MNKFFQFLFGRGQLSSMEVIDIEELTVADSNDGKTEVSRAPIADILVVRMNWCIAFVLLTSFAAILFLVVVRGVESVPDIVQNTFTLSLGFFINAVATYFRLPRSNN